MTELFEFDEAGNVIGPAKRKLRPWKRRRDGVVVDRETDYEIGTIVLQEPIRFAGVTGARPMWRGEGPAGTVTTHKLADAGEALWCWYREHDTVGYAMGASCV